MIHLINQQNFRDHAALLRGMHADRKRVFVDLLRWDLATDGELERDAFDDESAEYIVLQDSQTSAHRASMRLLRTDRPHLMSEVFPSLCEEGVPSGPTIREITRFCVSPRGSAAQRRLARNMITRAMVQYALLTGIHAFTAACNMRFLSEVLSAGWRCCPLGLPEVIDGDPVGALRINIDAATLRSLNAQWACGPIDFRIAEPINRLAA